jgi:hypothetical protein
MRRYLVFYYRLFRYYKLWIPAISEFIERTGSRSYLECCSGSGEILGLVVSNIPGKIADDRNFILSDIKPLPEFVNKINADRDSKIRYNETPLDATQIPAELNYPRIFINSFHHFAPETASRIIQSSVQDGQGIIILEYVRHSPLGYLSMLAGSLIILVTLPFVVAPRRLFLMALLTYAIPLFPLMFLWDGVVSCLRVYRPEELSSIATEAGISVEISSVVKRSLLYPAGVSATCIFPDRTASWQGADH